MCSEGEGNEPELPEYLNAPTRDKASREGNKAEGEPLPKLEFPPLDLTKLLDVHSADEQNARSDQT